MAPLLSETLRLKLLGTASSKSLPMVSSRFSSSWLSSTLESSDGGESSRTNTGCLAGTFFAITAGYFSIICLLAPIPFGRKGLNELKIEPALEILYYLVVPASLSISLSISSTIIRVVPIISCWSKLRAWLSLNFSISYISKFLYTKSRLASCYEFSKESF